LKKNFVYICVVSLFLILITFQLSLNTSLEKKITGESTHPYANVTSNYKKDVKISAYLDNMSPTKNSTIYLTVNGPSGGTVTVISHFKNNSLVIPGDIGTDGIASIPIQVGNAEANFTVIVDVMVDYNGKTYKTNTVFTPR
jgi:competence protein ComEC